MLKRIFSLSNGALLVALALSTIAAWYSIIGLTAIFAGAVVPIIIMGTALEFAKITTTVWLRKYWYRCSWVMKVYLVPAVVALALLTSMGIFGFLSKAHLDQNIGSGDVQAQVSLLDEKISVQRENIRSSKAALAQMDTQVNDIMTKGDSEKSVERSVMIRKQQAKERASLLKDIEVANKEIQKLNEERAPIASEMRKVEAEVGPIKYIAALIYGDNPDANVLERAVRWVIILLVVVFDPLAIMLVLAANQSKEWDEHIEEENKLHEDLEHKKTMDKLVQDDIAAMSIVPPDESTLRPFTQEEMDALDGKPKYEADNGPLTSDQIEQIKEVAKEELPVGEVITKSSLFDDEYSEEEITAINDTLAEAKVVEEVEVEIPEEYKSILAQHPYLSKPFVHFGDMKPMASRVEEYIEPAPMPEPKGDSPERPGDYVEPYTERHLEDKSPSIDTHGVTAEPFSVVGDGYVDYEGKRMAESVLRSMRPDLFSLHPDDQPGVRTGFGIAFPEFAHAGDTFVRVDTIPNRVFKFNGVKWIESQSETHLTNSEYINHLIGKLSTGEYDPELLSDAEQEAVTQHIKNQKI